MRFRNGFWHLDDDVSLYSNRHYIEAEASDGKLTLYACSSPAVRRDDTLNEPVITTEITAVADGILRVDAYHHKGGRTEKPFPQLPRCDAEVGDFHISAGALKAELKDGELIFSRNGRELTRRFSRLSGCMTTANGRWCALRTAFVWSLQKEAAAATIRALPGTASISRCRPTCRTRTSPCISRR